MPRILRGLQKIRIELVKENNLKTNVNDRFNKNRICKADNDAKLGVIVIPKAFGTKSKKEISYFWGYRDHVVIDVKSELPVVHDSVMFIPIFNLTLKIH